MTRAHLPEEKKEKKHDFSRPDSNPMTEEKTGGLHRAEQAPFFMALNKKSDDFIQGLRAGLPILLGYIPVAMAFGLLSRDAGLSLLHTALFSFVLYAGAAQFMAVNLIAAGVEGLSIIIAVFLLNLRLFVMATSLGVQLKKFPKRSLIPLGFMLTDEAFSILSFRRELMSPAFHLGVELLPYLSWGIFTVVGYFLGEILPPSLARGLSVGLTALFVALLVPAVKKKKGMGKVVLITTLIYIPLALSPLQARGWDLIAGILLSSLLAMGIKEVK